MPERSHFVAEDTYVDQLRIIVEQAAPAILQIDVDGIIRFASGYHLEELGVSTQALLGTSFRDFIGSEDNTVHLFQQALMGSFGVTEMSLGGCEFEVRLTPMVDQLGSTAGVTAVFLDITERAQAAAEVQRSEASFRVLIESSPDAVFVHRFSRIVYANETTKRLLRHESIEDILGKPVLELFAKEDRLQIAQKINSASNSAESSIDRYKLVRKDGDVGTFEVTTMSVQYDGDSAVVHIARDVTQALRMQKKLAQTERLASLGTLAGGVGHEINNPLAYMTANLSFIAEELRELLPATKSAENEDLHNALQDVRDGTDRVRDIVRQLNEFNRVDANTEELIDPRNAVEMAIRMSWNHLRRRTRLETRLHTTGLVRGNQARLGQVFLALLLNATEAFANQPLQECELVVRCYEKGDNVVIEVVDNGPGIPEHILSNIFDPFFSANSGGQGTGLGLSVAHSIIVDIGGHIDVDTQIGRGTRVEIHLPRAQERPVSASGDKRVLVVTDEVRFLESAQIALRAHTIRMAGRMSIASYDLDKPHFDAMICDLSSVDVDIATFAGKANTITNALVFVAQTGTSITEEESALASVLLRKPVGADTIAMQLDKLWKK